MNPILEDIKLRGHRITEARKAIVELLYFSKLPQSATEILKKLKDKSLKLNKTTVYRELEFLTKEKIAYSILLGDNITRYELIDDDNHHHHLVCTNCDKIQDIQMDNDLDNIENKITKTLNFKVNHHNLEFFGLCKQCQ